LVHTREGAISLLEQGCQIFLGTIYQNEEISMYIPNNHCINNWPKNIPNGRKMFQMTKITFQHSPFQSPSKFTQIGIFGLKTTFLLTLN
jgi:hypothetical protein